MPEFDDARDWQGSPTPRREKPETRIWVWWVRTERGAAVTEHRIRGMLDAVNLVCSAAREFMRGHHPDSEFGLVIRVGLEQMTLGQYREGKNG